MRAIWVDLKQYFFLYTCIYYFYCKTKAKTHIQQHKDDKNSEYRTVKEICHRNKQQGYVICVCCVDLLLQLCVCVCILSSLISSQYNEWMKKVIISNEQKAKGQQSHKCRFFNSLFNLCLIRKQFFLFTHFFPGNSDSLVVYSWKCCHLGLTRNINALLKCSSHIVLFVL